MLSSEQRNEVADDLHNMQREMVRTYASVQAADQEIMQSLRQAVHQDPVLRDDPVAIQCVEAIEEQTNQLQALPPTPESLLERSIMMESMQSQLSLLEERTQHINPNGPLSKVLKVFQKAWAAMAHMLSSVIKTVRYTFVS
jgi:tetrahydromethanopterin S-methyltransferase subunit A